MENKLLKDQWIDGNLFLNLQFLDLLFNLIIKINKTTNFYIILTSNLLFNKPIIKENNKLKCQKNKIYKTIIIIKLTEY
jgi:hypothetical protein